MLLLALPSGFDTIAIVVFFICAIVCVIAALMDAERWSVSFGGPTWKQWWKDLFNFKNKKEIPNEYILMNNFLKEFSSETPPSSDPYSGSEWDSTAASASSPSKTEESSLD